MNDRCPMYKPFFDLDLNALFSHQTVTVAKVLGVIFIMIGIIIGGRG